MQTSRQNGHSEGNSDADNDGDSDSKCEAMLSRWTPAIFCNSFMVSNGDFGGNKFLGEAEGGHSGLCVERMWVATYKQKKDQIRPLDQVTDREGLGGDPKYLNKCQKLETY